LARFLEARFGVPPRRALEFIVVAAAFMLADPTGTSLVLGAGLSLVGELLRVAAAGYGYNISALPAKGPYRFVRHPYFMGSALLFLGLCLAARDPFVMAFAVLAMTLTYRVDVRREEGRLAGRLGPRFAEYRDRVPAFLPQLVPAPLPNDDNHRFSFEYAVLRGHHRELDALLALAVSLGLLYLCYCLPAKDLFRLGVVITVGLYVGGRFIYCAMTGLTGRSGRRS